MMAEFAELFSAAFSGRKLCVLLPCPSVCRSLSGMAGTGPRES